MRATWLCLRVLPGGACTRRSPRPACIGLPRRAASRAYAALFARCHARLTRGVRTASFLWLQSMVRDDGERRTLFELDEAIQSVAASNGQGDPAVVKLTGIYHNLLRRWADA